MLVWFIEWKMCVNVYIIVLREFVGKNVKSVNDNF